MKRSRPDLVVPIRDRRQQRRILTLKNFGYTLLLFVAIFAGITIEANLRRGKAQSDFGRLSGSQVPSVPAVSKKPDIVQEAPIPDATAADPMLVGAAARSQLLRDDPVTTSSPLPPPPSAPRVEGRVAIVGGPEGVTVTQQIGTRPLLGGGFGH